MLRDRGLERFPTGMMGSGARMSERGVMHMADVVVLLMVWCLWDHMFLGHVRASFLLACTAIVGIVSWRDGTGGAGCGYSRVHFGFWYMAWLGCLDIHLS